MQLTKLLPVPIRLLKNTQRSNFVQISWSSLKTLLDFCSFYRMHVVAFVSSCRILFSKDASVRSVPVFDVYFDPEEKVAWDLKGDAVESNVLLPLNCPQGNQLIIAENHLFHSFWASTFRIPCRTKIIIPWQPTKIVKRSCNAKVASLDGVPLAARPNPQPSPNSTARLIAIVAFLRTKARVLFSVVLPAFLYECLQMDTMMSTNTIKLKA